MKSFIFALVIVFSTISCSNAQQQFSPEDVMYTIGSYQLKYKHVLAYVDMEMEGEDPTLAYEPGYIQELTVECLEEFAEAPETFLADLEIHYEAMQMGVGYDVQNNGTLTQYQGQANNQYYQQSNNNQQFNSGGGQWKQLLSGSVLYYTVTQSHNGMFVQSTQYMHLCPNGTALFYEESGGGGAVNPGRTMQFSGSANWNVIEQGGQAYFNVNMEGQPLNFPMRALNQKIQIQGLGNFSIQQGAAQCY